MRKLIFDIGAHTGEDTEFYLKKGFKVVAIEANPALVEELYKKFEQSNENLIIENKAVSDVNGFVDLFVNDEKPDWSSLFKGSAEKGEYASRRTSVPSERLEDLVNRHGLPYFLKCDIEDGDVIVAKQLFQISISLGESPEFVSFEFCNLEILDYLHKMGYMKFQVINQTYNWSLKAPLLSREGLFVEKRFTSHSSGLFGKELDPEKWVNFDCTKRIFYLFNELRLINPLICPGWLDIHGSK